MRLPGEIDRLRKVGLLGQNTPTLWSEHVIVDAEHKESQTPESCMKSGITQPIIVHDRGRVRGRKWEFGIPTSEYLVINRGMNRR